VAGQGNVNESLVQFQCHSCRGQADNSGLSEHFRRLLWRLTASRAWWVVDDGGETFVAVGESGCVVLIGRVSSLVSMVWTVFCR
jgi:hypothetical protein